MSEACWVLTVPDVQGLSLSFFFLPKGLENYQNLRKCWTFDMIVFKHKVRRAQGQLEIKFCPADESTHQTVLLEMLLDQCLYGHVQNSGFLQKK